MKKKKNKPTLKAGREEIIQFIRANDIFYFGVSFDGHSNEQLIAIKERLEAALRKARRTKSRKKG